MSDKSAKTEHVHFHNEDGYKLSGALDLPKDGDPKAYTVFSHCFTCSKYFKAAVYLGRELAQRGVAMLRFDFPGLGKSEGDFSQTTFTGYISDINKAADFLRREYQSPVALIGHSLGGAASIAAANGIGSVDWVITIAAPSKPGKLAPRLKQAREEAEATGLGRLEVQGNSFELKMDFFNDMERAHLEPAVRNLRPDLLAIHAPDDDTVPYHNVETLLEWAGERGELLKMDGAGHMYGDREQVAKIADEIVKRIL